MSKMIQFDKAVNLMLKIQCSVYKEAQNLVLSPYALEVLAFTIMSGTSGQCLDELSTFLFGETIPYTDLVDTIRSYKLIMVQIGSITTSTTLRMNNLIYIHDTFPLNSSFEDFTSTCLETRVRKINFEDGKTEIVKVIEEDIKNTSDPNGGSKLKFVPNVSKLLFFNDIFMEAELASKPTKVYPKEFKATNGEKTTAQFQVFRGSFRMFEVEPNFVYIELPYANELMTLSLLIPKPSATIRGVLNNLNYELLMKLFQTSVPKMCEVHLPLARLRSNIDLTFVLQLAGIKKIFNRAEADFSRMIKDSAAKGLSAESIVVNCQLNYSKPQASLAQEAKPEALPSFIMDKPFVYLISCRIQNVQNVILFSGAFNMVEPFP